MKRLDAKPKFYVYRVKGIKSTRKYVTYVEPIRDDVEVLADVYDTNTVSKILAI